jgi:hypothetical protein
LVREGSVVGRLKGKIEGGRMMVMVGVEVEE